MNIFKVQAADRFDNTEFTNEVEDGRARSIYSAYTCPGCATPIGFHKRDFQDGARQQRTNLASGVATRFDEFARTNGIGTDDFLDWICPKCRLAARVYVQFWAGGRHGDCGITLLTVIEAQT